MTSKKTTRRALFSSVMALILCCAMLVGSTFAWFTDSVSSVNNVITAGNLDVEVYNGLTTEDPNLDDVQKLFSKVDLWEPGVVAYENLTVANVGTLALKYELAVNFDNENTVDGYGLSQILKVAVVEGGVTETGRDALVASITDWQDMASFELTGDLEDGETTTYGLVIYWEPSADDNNWNVNNGKETSDGEPLHIDLGVNLFATQLAAEEDSFGSDYDAKAWSDVMEPIQPDENGVVYVYTPNQLASIGTTEGVKVVEIMADIDLVGRLWTPIDVNSGYADLTINGNGHTISNMTINDLGGSNMQTYGTGFIGNLYAGSVEMNDLTFEGASVTSTGSFVGVAVGYAYYGELTLNNVDVKNSTVASTAEKGIRVGALVGAKFMFDGAEQSTADGFSVVDCDASGNTITGYHNVGGLIGSILYGTAKTNDTIKNCTVSDTTLIHTNPNDWAANALACDGMNAVTDDDFVATNVVSKTCVVYKDATISEIEYLNVKDDQIVIYENCVFDAAFGNVNQAVVEGTLILRDCTFNGNFHLDNPNGGTVEIDGCIFTELGWFKLGAGGDVTVKNSTFKAVDMDATSGWGRQWIITYGDITFENCDLYRQVRSAGDHELTFISCTYNGEALTEDAVYDYANPTVTIK